MDCKVSQTHFSLPIIDTQEVVNTGPKWRLSSSSYTQAFDRISHCRHKIQNTSVYQIDVRDLGHLFNDPS